MAGAEQIGELFHKEKEAKRNITDKRSNVNSLIDHRTIVQGSTPVNSTIEKLEEHQNRQKSIAQKLEQHERHTRLLANARIDESLHNWVMEGLTTEAYLPWVAKCCHILGLTKVNELAIAARRGKSPQNLFASLLIGARKLKQEQFRSDIDTKPEHLTGDIDG